MPLCHCLSRSLVFPIDFRSISKRTRCDHVFLQLFETCFPTHVSRCLDYTVSHHSTSNTTFSQNPAVSRIVTLKTPAAKLRYGISRDGRPVWRSTCSTRSTRSTRCDCDDVPGAAETESSDGERWHHQSFTMSDAFSNTKHQM